MLQSKEWWKNFCHNTLPAVLSHPEYHSLSLGCVSICSYHARIYWQKYYDQYNSIWSLHINKRIDIFDLSVECTRLWNLSWRSKSMQYGRECLWARVRESNNVIHLVALAASGKINRPPTLFEPHRVPHSIAQMLRGARIVGTGSVQSENGVTKHYVFFDQSPRCIRISGELQLIPWRTPKDPLAKRGSFFMCHRIITTCSSWKYPSLLSLSSCNRGWCIVRRQWVMWWWVRVHWIIASWRPWVASKNSCGSGYYPPKCPLFHDRFFHIVTTRRNMFAVRRMSQSPCPKRMIRRKGFLVCLYSGDECTLQWIHYQSL